VKVIVRQVIVWTAEVDSSDDIKRLRRDELEGGSAICDLVQHAGEVDIQTYTIRAAE
jgi:hypothetical protein